MHLVNTNCTLPTFTFWFGRWTFEISFSYKPNLVRLPFLSFLLRQQVFLLTLKTVSNHHIHLWIVTLLSWSLCWERDMDREKILPYFKNMSFFYKLFKMAISQWIMSGKIFTKNDLKNASLPLSLFLFIWSSVYRRTGHVTFHLLYYPAYRSFTKCQVWVTDAVVRNKKKCLVFLVAKW